VHAVAAKRIEIRRQGRDQRLALARAHFCDIAVMQDHAANQLHIERPQTELAPRGFPCNRKRLG
jgi:hypothetical protein